MHNIFTQSIQDQVYTLLHAAICEGRPGFRPGDRIHPARIASQFKVSVTPVKEALNKLESDGLVVLKPRSGTFVATLSEKDIRELTAVRQGLETWALKLRQAPLAPEWATKMQAILDEWAECQKAEDVVGASRAHRAFHRCLVAASGNDVLLDLYDYLMSRASLFMAYHTNHYLLTQEELANHRALFEAVVADEWSRVEKLMEKHFALALERALEQKKRRKHEQAASVSPPVPSA